MKPLHVVVAQPDPKLANPLVRTLSEHFRSVNLANSMGQLRKQISEQRPDVLVIDLELADLQVVEQIHLHYGRTAIVCTHPHAALEEDVWQAAREAGAIDCVRAADVQAVLSAAHRHPPIAKGTAA